MRQQMLKKIFKTTFLSIMSLALVGPVSTKAITLASDEIQISEYRDCSDATAGWSGSTPKVTITNPDTENGPEQCFLQYASDYSFTHMYKDPLSSGANHAFRLNAKNISPAISRLNINGTSSSVVKDDTVKCKINTNLLTNNGIRAGLGAIIANITSDEKVAGVEYYYGSLAMSQFIYKHTNDATYKVSNVNETSYNAYLTLAETEYIKATTKVEPQINNKTISEFDMAYFGDQNNRVFSWKGTDFITFKNMKYLSGLINNNFNEPIFEYKLINTTTGKDYSSYAMSAIQNSGIATENDLTYQFGVKDDANLESGDYVFTVIVKDKINYTKVKNLYSCSSEKNDGTSYTPIALSNDNTIASKDNSNNINYTLTSKFTVSDYDANDDFGSIHVMTVDSDKNVLTGTTLKLCTTADCAKVVGTSIDGKLSISPVPVGSYYLVTTDVPTEYTKIATRKVTIAKNTLYEEDIVLSKNTNTGAVNIKILDKNNKEISDAEIKICSTSDCKDGVLYSAKGNYEQDDISYGTYYIVIDAPKDYVEQKAIEFTLSNEIKTFNKAIIVEAKTVVPDTLSNISKIFIVCGLAGIIAGVYLVYTNAKKQEEV